MAEHVLDLAVLALAHREGKPDIRALLAVELGLDRAVTYTVDDDAAAQPGKLVRLHAPVRAHAVAPQPAGRRQLEHPRKSAIVGEEQQSLGIGVEPADAEEPR